MTIFTCIAIYFLIVAPAIYFLHRKYQPIVFTNSEPAPCWTEAPR